VPRVSPRTDVLRTLPAAALLAAAGLIGCVAPGDGPLEPRPGTRPAASSVPNDARVAPAFAVTPEQRVKAGELLRDAGQLDAALEEFNRVLRDSPQMVDAHVGVGTVQHKKEEYERAKDTFAFAAGLDAMHFDARYYLGLMHQVLGDTGQAILSYREALAIDPDDAKAHRDLATAYLQIGRPSLAIPSPTTRRPGATSRPPTRWKSATTTRWTPTAPRPSWATWTRRCCWGWATPT